MKRLTLILTVLLPACLLFAACSSQGHFVRTELYFGLCKNEVCADDDDFITEAQWQNFVDNVVTPKFREGLTVVEAKGQWTNSRTGKMIRERSKILVLLHEDKGSDEEAIEDIRRSYKSLFGQTSVIKVEAAVDFSY